VRNFLTALFLIALAACAQTNDRLLGDEYLTSSEARSCAAFLLGVEEISFDIPLIYVDRGLKAIQ